MHLHNKSSSSNHFKGKNPLEHVIEAQAEGLVCSTEMHGQEPAGYLSAGCDSARETAFIFSLLSILFSHLIVGSEEKLTLFFYCTLSLIFWKMGRSAWLGWFRLERLHRVLEQERFEIEHHRQQEREELKELYAAKGFEGKLLEEVLDVLMADNDRLLKVMVEEELGLSLEKTEHPLKQGLGATFGVILTACLAISSSFLLPEYGLFLGAFLAIALASFVSASLAKNNFVPAVVWNLGIAFSAIATLFFLLQ